jgi:soluble lytic murein transglycosylase-like protein
VDEDVSLRFEGGGSMTIPLERVSRIIDDEIDHTPPPAPVAAAVEPAKPTRSMRTSSRPKGLGSTPYDSLILAAAKEHEVDPALIAAVIRAESNFAPRAVSRKGARGLMQLMPATARRLGVTRVFDPKENIRAGTAYLSELATRFGETSVELIAAAYNAGENAVDEYKGVPPYRETTDYVKRVTRFWNAAYGEEQLAETSAPPPAGTTGGGR